MDLFDSILAECKNGTNKFANRFHRFRSEGKEETRLRIKRGLIIDDKTGEFFIVDRLTNGGDKKEKFISSNKNKSCWTK